MRCDLHIHSRHSTGTQTIPEILGEAAAKGIGLISVTDDDTMAAHPELARLAPVAGAAWIPGGQVSASWGKLPMFRFLAYGCDPDDAALQAMLAGNRARMDAFGEALVALLVRHHDGLSVAGYRAHRKDPAFGGFRYNSYMNAAGLDGRYEASRDLFLPHRDALAPAFAALGFPPVEEAVAAVHAAGGRAVVTGGYLRDADTFAADLERAAAIGMDGVETGSVSHAPGMAAAARSVADRLGLLTTGGGDGHGTWTDPARFGIGLVEVTLADLRLGDLPIHLPDGRLARADAVGDEVAGRSG
jgi:predicted metal-dependent phosphoesterase TrpH